jgi:hypothetical protein
VGRRGWSGALAWAAIQAASCSQPTDRQPFPGTCAPFAVVEWTPPGQAEGVPTNAVVELVFSDYPEPDSVGPQDFLLMSGIQRRIGAFKIDLITKSIRFRTTNPLYPNLTYTMMVLGPLQSLQGCPVREEQRSFHTGTVPAPVTPGGAAPAFAAVLEIFARSCGGGACHRQAQDQGGGCLEAPAKGLSLCDGEAYDALVGVGAREVSRLERVLPRDSSRSYLLRKLVSPTETGPPVPTTPGHHDPPGGSLDATQLRIIADWIDGGAAR